MNWGPFETSHVHPEMKNKYKIIFGQTSCFWYLREGLLLSDFFD